MEKAVLKENKEFKIDITNERRTVTLIKLKSNFAAKI